MSRRLERALAGVLAALFLLLAGPVLAEAVAADVAQLQVERGDDGLLLSASIRFDLSPVVEDALAKGIPMFFVAEATLLRDRWWWTDKELNTAARHMRLSYQPLTRKWRLVISSSPVGNSGLALGQTFDTREEALAGVQRISHWKIADLSELENDGRYNVEFRFRLDVTQLPRPFQIGAMGHGDWSISASRNVRITNEAR